MDILAHRVEAGLQGKVLLKRIAGREAQLRCVIGLDNTCFVMRLQKCFLRRQLIVFIDIHVTGAQHIEHRIAQTGRDRQFLCERTFVVDVNGTLQGLFPLQLIGLDE